MSRVIMFKENRDKRICANYLDTETNINKKYYISGFNINEQIVDLTFKKEKLYIFLTNDYTIILPNLDILNNKLFKTLRRMVEKEFIKHACNYYTKKLKYSLNTIKVEGKVLTASALAAAIAFTTVHIMDKENDMISYNIDTNSPLAMNMNFELLSDNIETSHTIRLPELEQIDVEIVEPVYSEEEQIIMKYAAMYFINYIEAAKYIEENMDLVNQYDSFELGILTCLKDYHWNDESIDKTPMMSSLTEDEKEKFILEMANVYGIKDEETLSVLLAVHRLETFYGTSDVYLNLNNCGGVMEYNDDLKKQVYIKYKTFEIGAESFVRTFYKVKERVIEKARNNETGFNENWSLARNMDSVYCGNIVPSNQQSWHEIAEEIVEKVIDSQILDEYVEKPGNQLILN